MTLALVGSGEYLPPMEAVDRKLIEMLGRPARVVCLPTAAGQEGPGRIAYWSELGTAHFTRLGAQVEALPVIDRHGANDPTWAEKIRQANFVYLSGGKPGYLFDTLENTPVWEAILSVHQTGGVLAGCSAGAMILGDALPGFPRWEKGFGLLPGAVIVPHYDEFSSALRRLIELALPRRKFMVGIEGDTALVVKPDGYVALGRRSVAIYKSGVQRRYTHGEVIDWPEAGAQA